MAVPRAWLRAAAFLCLVFFILQQLHTPQVNLEPSPSWATKIWRVDDCSKPIGAWPFIKHVAVSIQEWCACLGSYALNVSYPLMHFEAWFFQI